MTLLSKSIIFIGFKHVGKSVIGNALALRLAKPFIDLDEERVNVYVKIILNECMRFDPTI